MKLHILSDVHLEHAAFTPPKTDADVVILAGDIGVGSQGLRWAAQTFPRQRVLYVPGNHEFYNKNPESVVQEMQELTRTGHVSLLDRECVVIDGVRFLGATLWTDFEVHGYAFKDLAMHACRDRMSDYSCIFKSGRLLTPRDTESYHERDRFWLDKELRMPFEGPTVVVTHHAPHPRSISERFRHDLLTAGFCSDLSDLMGFPGLWIHGHTHDPFDYQLGETRVICNPRGYPGEHTQGQVRSFNPSLIVEIGCN